jgi:MoxR-like ATPase
MAVTPDGVRGDGGHASDLQASDARACAQVAQDIIANVNRVIVGKSQVIGLLLVALLSEGHTLIEDVPGLGKTVLARALARSVEGSFARIQGTADLLPSDVTGLSFYNQKAGEFEFRQGPLFANIVLADEVNRATPRTQSALLEAMQERQVTVDGETMRPPRPFLLIATQNPIELEGTFPLPEAQLDRFLLRLRMAYPTKDEERAMLFRFKETEPLETLKPVTGAETLIGMAETVRRVRVTQDVADYILTIVRGTREHPAVELGASPRASLALFRASQAHAAIHGRLYVKPDDVKQLAIAALAHRLTLTAQSRVRQLDAEQVVTDVLEKAAIPVESLGADSR